MPFVCFIHRGCVSVSRIVYFIKWVLIVMMFGNLNRSSLSEPSNNKASPATPRVSKLTRGVAKSDADSPSPLQNPRLSVDRSPRSINSKPTVDRRSPKLATPPEVTSLDAYELSECSNLNFAAWFALLTCKFGVGFKYGAQFTH